MNIPISLTTKSFSPAMLAKPGQRSVFHLMITAAIGQPEGGVKPPTDLLLVIDGSGSMGGDIEGTADVRMDKVKEAGQLAIDNLQPTDRVAVVRFSSSAEIKLSLTYCDGAGKQQAGNVLWGLRSSGGTAFSTGLACALQVFGEPDPNRNRVCLFLTDGANEGEREDAPYPFCERMKTVKVTLYIAGLGVSNQWEGILQKMAAINSVETNFRGLSTSQDVLAFFADVQAAASSTLIKNARLKLTQPNFVTVQNFELVTRCKQPNYVPADASGTTVTIGDLGAGDELDFYLCMQLVLPENITPGRRSFGKLEFCGEASGSSSEQVLCAGNVVVPFVQQLPAGAQPDAEVREMMGLAATARELYAASNTTGAAAAQHVAAAAEQARKTVPFNRQGAAFALAANLAKVQQAIAAGDPNAIAQEARRATRGFSPAERARALAALDKK